MINYTKHIVTKPSYDGTFQIGDIIWKDDKGYIFCANIGGYLKPDDLDEAVRGMECKSIGLSVEESIVRFEGNLRALRGGYK
jgi:hypothetical protein